MLTKDDLKQIGEVVEEKVELKITPIKKDISILKNSVKKIQKTIDVVAKVLDRADVVLNKRVKRLEEHARIRNVN